MRAASLQLAHKAGWGCCRPRANFRRMSCEGAKPASRVLSNTASGVSNGPLAFPAQPQTSLPWGGHPERFRGFAGTPCQAGPGCGRRSLVANQLPHARIGRSDIWRPPQGRPARLQRSASLPARCAPFVTFTKRIVDRGRCRAVSLASGCRLREVVETASRGRLEVEIRVLQERLAQSRWEPFQLTPGTGTTFAHRPRRSKAKSQGEAARLLTCGLLARISARLAGFQNLQAAR